MESFNLKTASTYINNLLLARGLLRDGTPIEFAHPSRGEGGKEVTMAQIINLVHDLILKRDRDQEHRESLAGTLRTLRNDTTRQTVALEKLQTRNEDLARQLSLAQSQERSARAALRTAESSARSLREEMLRLKTSVLQVRTSCANDIRKRDVQMQRLKGHLTGQQRGNRAGVVGASITINPGTAGLGGLGSARDEALEVDDPEYSLRQETTEFLTQLSQSLSDENDNLIGLVRSTLVTLKELQGISLVPGHEDDAALGAIGEEDEDADESAGQGMMHGLPTSYETLATDMDTVLENLKSLLTNPNFVSVDEVEMREEEIVKLRMGWDRMETRWRDTLALMERWRRRMADGGDTINLEELRMGLGLGSGLELPNNHQESIPSEDQGDEDDASSDLDQVLYEAEELEQPPSPAADDVSDKATATDMFNLKLRPDQPALRGGSGNIKSPRKVAFSASIPNTPSTVVDENVNEDASELDSLSAAKRIRTRSATKANRSAEQTRIPTPQDSRISRQVRCDNFADQITKLASKVTLSSSSTSSTSSSPSPSIPGLSPALYIDDLQPTKRLSEEHAHPDERSPKLTVQAKLLAAQEEAEAAAVAEASKPAKPATLEQVKEGGDNGERKERHRSSPIKTRVTGRPRRRRKSTLTPAELGDLLGFE